MGFLFVNHTKQIIKKSYHYHHLRGYMGKKRRKSKKRKAAKARKNRKCEAFRLTEQKSDERKRDESAENKTQAGQNKDEINATVKWPKIREIFQKRGVLVFIIVIIGGSFLLGGFIFICHNEIQEIFAWQEKGSMVAIACDIPLQGVEVNCTTTEDGKTKILISSAAGEDIWPEIVKRYGNTKNINIEEMNFKSDMYINDLEEYHLWVYVAALGAPMEWSIDERFGNVENYNVGIESTIDNYILRKSDEQQGTAFLTAFRITFGSDYINMAEIEISEPTEHVMYSTNGIYRADLPRIGPWFGSIEYDLDEWVSVYDFLQHDEPPRMAGLEMLNLTINGEPMYYAGIKINATYAMVSLMMQSDLELMLVSPESIGGYPLIRWSEYDHLFPIVQFRDTKWENRVIRDNLLGGIFVGLGINVLSLLRGFLFRKKED